MRNNSDYRFAPPGWQYTYPNPYCSDGQYGQGWSAFCLEDRDDDHLITGTFGEGPFSARFGRRVSNLAHRLVDFITYENAHDRRVILSFPPDVEGDDFLDQAFSCTPDPSTIRPEDPAIIVHSTTRAAWKQIRADGELKAASLIREEKEEASHTLPSGPIAEYLRHEPPEYNQYIMFGDFETCGPELVNASYQLGAFVSDENTVYTPGVRLYIDNHRLIKDGLGTRDGLHLMKVHRSLPLRRYLLAAVGKEDVEPLQTGRSWTIREFVTATNAHFNRAR